MSLAWHSHSDWLLAFGTDNWKSGLGGGFGLLLLPEQGSGLHTVTWGKGVEGVDNDQVMLYSSWEGKVVQHCTRSSNGAGYTGDHREGQHCDSAKQGVWQVLVKREQVQ